MGWNSTRRMTLIVLIILSADAFSPKAPISGLSRTPLAGSKQFCRVFELTRRKLRKGIPSLSANPSQDSSTTGNSESKLDQLVRLRRLQQETETQKRAIEEQDYSPEAVAAREAARKSREEEEEKDKRTREAERRERARVALERARAEDQAAAQRRQEAAAAAAAATAAEAERREAERAAAEAAERAGTDREPVATAEEAKRLLRSLHVEDAEAALAAARQKLAVLDVEGARQERDRAALFFEQAHAVFQVVGAEAWSHAEELNALDQAIADVGRRRDALAKARHALDCAERLLGSGDLEAARRETISAALLLDAAGDAVDLQDQEKKADLEKAIDAAERKKEEEKKKERAEQLQSGLAAIADANQRITDLDFQGAEMKKDEASRFFTRAYAVFGRVEQEYESKLTEVQQSIDAARKRREARSNGEGAMKAAERCLAAAELDGAQRERGSAAMWFAMAALDAAAEQEYEARMAALEKAIEDAVQRRREERMKHIASAEAALAAAQLQLVELNSDAAEAEREKASAGLASGKRVLGDAYEDTRLAEAIGKLDADIAAAKKRAAALAAGEAAVETARGLLAGEDFEGALREIASAATCFESARALAVGANAQDERLVQEERLVELRLAVDEAIRKKEAERAAAVALGEEAIRAAMRMLSALDIEGAEVEKKKAAESFAKARAVSGGEDGALVGKLAALDDATEKARKRAAAAASGEVALKGAQNMLEDGDFAGASKELENASMWFEIATDGIDDAALKMQEQNSASQKIAAVESAMEAAMQRKREARELQIQLAEAAIGAAELKLADLDVQGGEAAREEARACFSEAHAVFGAVEPEHVEKLAFLDQAIAATRTITEALQAGESALKASQQRLAEDDLDAARKDLASAAKWFGRVGACSVKGQVRVGLGESEMAALSTAVEQAVQKRREEEEARRKAAAEAEAAAASEAKVAQGAAAAKKQAVVEMEAMLQKLREEAEVSQRAAEEANFAAQQAAARKKALEDEEVSAVLKKLQDEAEDAELAAARAQTKAKETKQAMEEISLSFSDRLTAISASSSQTLTKVAQESRQEEEDTRRDNEGGMDEVMIKEEDKEDMEIMAMEGKKKEAEVLAPAEEPKDADSEHAHIQKSDEKEREAIAERRPVRPLSFADRLASIATSSSKVLTEAGDEDRRKDEEEEARQEKARQEGNARQHGQNLKPYSIPRVSLSQKLADIEAKLEKIDNVPPTDLSQFRREALDALREQIKRQEDQ